MTDSMTPEINFFYDNLMFLEEQRYSQTNTFPLTIASFPIRGKSQVLKLVCEYLHCPYTDKIFNPEQCFNLQNTNQNLIR